MSTIEAERATAFDKPDSTKGELSLQAVIDARRRLDELSCARVVGHAADAVHAAQQGGQPLGTITPSAIVVAPDGAVRLATGAPALRYTAPEKLRGAAVDRRADVFALGVVLWEALAHEPLFEGTGDDAIRQAVLERAIRRPSELNANVPAEIDAICTRALARDPAERYQSARVMAAEIDAVLGDAGYPESNEQIATYVANALGSRPNSTAAPTTSRVPTNPLPSIPANSDAPHEPPASSSEPVTLPLQFASKPAHEAPELASKPAALAADTSARAAAPSRAFPETWPPPTSSNAAPATLPWTYASARLPAPAVVLGSPSTPPSESAESPAEVANPVTSPAGNGEAEPMAAVAAQNFPGTGAGKFARTEVFGAVPPPSDKPLATSAGFGSNASAPPAPSTPAAPAMPAPRSHPGIPQSHPIISGPPAIAGDTKPGLAVKPAPHPPPMSSIASAETVMTPQLPAWPRGADAAGVFDEEHRADPADVIALHRAEKRTSSSRDVLAGWGWSTGPIQALDDDDIDEAALAALAGRRRLLIAIGGALGVIGIIAVVALAFGQAKPSEPDPGAPVRSSTAPTPPAAASAAAPAPPPGLATAEPAAAPPSEPLKSEAAAVAPPAPPAPRAEAPVPPPAKAEPPAPAPPAGFKLPGPVAPQPPTREPVKKLEPQKPAEPQTPAEPQKPVAHVVKRPPPPQQPPTREPVKKLEPQKPAEPQRPVEHAVKRPPPPPARITKPTPREQPVDPYGAPGGPRTDPTDAYRIGLQQYARGDTAGALATLRSSLLAHPSFAPTWRGLGLVYEKLGNTAQARSAYRRYLQLSPTASDADQIRDRMERLGS